MNDITINKSENQPLVYPGKKIGIFGGSFDPFGIGHAAVVKRAYKQLGLDKLVIVPTTVNYYRGDKRYLFTFDEKVRIIQDFICGAPENIEIDTIEKDKDGNWRTIDLVQYFRQKYPDATLYLIIGEDSLKEFRTWTRWREIPDYARICVANRSDHVAKTFDINNNSDPDDCLIVTPIDMGTDFEDCSATNTRNRLIEELIDMYLADKDWYGQVL